MRPRELALTAQGRSQNRTRGQPAAHLNGFIKPVAAGEETRCHRNAIMLLMRVREQRAQCPLWDAFKTLERIMNFRPSIIAVHVHTEYYDVRVVYNLHNLEWNLNAVWNL